VVRAPDGKHCINTYVYDNRVDKVSARHAYMCRFGFGSIGARIDLGGRTICGKVWEIGGRRFVSAREVFEVALLQARQVYAAGEISASDDSYAYRHGTPSGTC
jgi:hypothetical protein